LKGLTEKQRAIFEFVRIYMEKHGMPPTRQEIADAFEFKSANAAQQHLEAIVRKGWLIFRPGAARGIRLAQGH
jgi:repressor LexA